MVRTIRDYSGNMSMETKKYPEFQGLLVQEGPSWKPTSDFRQHANFAEPLPVFGSLLITSGGHPEGQLKHPCISGHL